MITTFEAYHYYHKLERVAGWLRKIQYWRHGTLWFEYLNKKLQSLSGKYKQLFADVLQNRYS